MERKVLYYIKEIEQAKRGIPISPITCEIDPSNRCQLDCSFCLYKTWRSISRADLSWDVYKKLLKDLRNNGAKSVSFTGGGEPLLNPKFQTMFDAAILSGFEVGLVTNGVQLNKIEHLAEFMFIRVSLDAASAKTYEIVKGVNLFDKVIRNIKSAIEDGAVLGLSFVVTEENKHEIEKAKELADTLNVAYIQFKPAWSEGFKKLILFDGYNELTGDKTVNTARYTPDSTLPCHIAGLVGIVGADAIVYYCCTKRGVRQYALGSLEKENFEDIWRRRPAIEPMVSQCPACRYMTYARPYEKFISGGTLFFQHKHFL